MSTNISARRSVSDHCLPGKKNRWVADAIRAIDADFNRSADTHLIRADMPPVWDGWQLYFKDESVHPTGSLKHRLARSLFLFGLANGNIGPDTPIIEASSGSTAVSEAYFARLLGLRSIAVMPHSTSREKIAKIEFYGGECHLVEPADIYTESKRLARDLGGHYMNQFANAERATDWRGNNNIAESLFDQMAQEPHPHPRWVVVSAGTGGTAATIGRYMRFCGFGGCPSQLCVVDPENSVFADCYETGDRSVTTTKSSRIEGIGRPRVEPSFIPTVIDRMERVPDAASRAALSGNRAGPALRRVHRHQPYRRGAAAGGNAPAQRARQHRHADMRRRRTLRRHLLQRRLAGCRKHRHPTLAAGAGTLGPNG